MPEERLRNMNFAIRAGRRKETRKEKEVCEMKIIQMEISGRRSHIASHEKHKAQQKLFVLRKARRHIIYMTHSSCDVIPTHSLELSAAAAYLLLGSHAIPKWLNPFAAQDSKNHHERVEEVVEVPARDRVGIEGLRRVVLAEQLHSDDGENVNDDDQNERQVS